ncbi:biotin/lipoyl-binding protein [Candidatus Parabeggiatoa sp. HSG14]|uniref:efflux RND transporter periplasmic adaptor subunit n=1 Tax=Candidatus Parabeggiatoa sp. HSG14 TaxID=3055593 RepID=UPI0025A6F6A0|nr:biotin/lipoyl-binding protein [Thiotrichales bacterium HSG14]
MKKSLYFLLPLLILAIGVMSYMYMLETQSKNAPIKIEEQAWIVTTVSITPTTLSPTLTLYGRVESPRTATLRTPTLSVANTEVKKVFVFEGEKVKKGEILIRLEESDSRLYLKQREADMTDIKAQMTLEKQRHANNLIAIVHEEALLKLTKKSLERLRKLKKQRVSSQSASENAQQAVERQMLAVTRMRLDIKNHKARLAQLQAKHTHVLAQRDIARLELARTKIKAPFSGVLAKVLVAVGDRVRTGDALLRLYDDTALEVRAQIPSRYQGMILNALVAKHQLQAQTHIHNKLIALQLERVSGQINSDSGGIDGLFQVKNAYGLLRLGEFLTLYLNLPQQSRVVALPYEAVYGINRIYKLVEGRMKGLTIERVGEQMIEKGKTKILVRSPELKSEEQVIITQLPNAMEGLKVKASSPSSTHPPNLSN